MDLFIRNDSKNAEFVFCDSSSPSNIRAHRAWYGQLPCTLLFQQTLGHLNGTKLKLIRSMNSMK